MLDPLHSLHMLRWRWCWQMLDARILCGGFLCAGGRTCLAFDLVFSCSRSAAPSLQPHQLASMRMKHFLFRRQVLNWEYLLSIPSLLVRLPVTVANVNEQVPDNSFASSHQGRSAATPSTFAAFYAQRYHSCSSFGHSFAPCAVASSLHHYSLLQLVSASTRSRFCGSVHPPPWILPSGSGSVQRLVLGNESSSPGT